MADTLKKNSTILYATHPGGPVRCGTIGGTSPSGRYARLDHLSRTDGAPRMEREWVAVNQVCVLEVLSEPADEAAVESVPNVPAKDPVKLDPAPDPKGVGLQNTQNNAEGEKTEGAATN